MNYLILTFGILLFLSSCASKKVHTTIPQVPTITKEQNLTSAETNTTTPKYIIDKEECVQMISQEKFDKYTKMFGSEAASIKRCTMIKTMSTS